MGSETDRVVVIARGRLPVTAMMQLHRSLGLGVTEVRRRLEAGTPLIDRGLWLNDQPRLEALLHEVLDLLGEPVAEVHVVPPGGSPDETTRRPVSVLWNMIEEAAPPPEPVPPAPNASVARGLADALRAAVASLPAAVWARTRVVELAAYEGDPYPHLSLTVKGPDGGESEVIEGVGDGFFALGAPEWVRATELPGDRVEAAQTDATLGATLEEALRFLDIEGDFAADRPRDDILLLSTTGGVTGATGAARRLNPFGPLLRDWLSESAEEPVIDPAPTFPSPMPSDGAAPPNSVLAELWRHSNGVMLDDGTSIYAADEITERNATFQVAEYAPGWVLIGDDSGGRGYLMRHSPAQFHPATGRTGAEVFVLDLGALTPDIAAEAEFVTDDLIGWLGRRQQRDAMSAAD